MNKLCYALAMLSLPMLMSCDETKRLASNMAGVWTSAPEHLVDNAAATATIIETYDFERIGNDNNGPVTLSALINVTSPVNGIEGMPQAFSMSASATASIAGQWQAVSDDDVVFTWDDKSIKVSVDPSAVVLSANATASNESPAVDSIKPQLAESIRAQIARAVEVRFLGTRRFDDIKIHKTGLMEYEVADRDYTMQRQSQD